MDPKNPSHVFANDSYCIFESTDSGATWSRADSGIGFRNFIDPFDWVNIAFDSGDNVILTADQGVLKYSPSNAAGQQWSSLMGNLEVSEFYTVSLDPSNAGAAYAIGQDISAQRYSGDLVWNIMDSSISEIGKILVDPNDSSLLYAFNPLAPGNLVMRSKDGGNTWNGIYSTGAFAANDYSQASAVQYSFAIADSSRLLFGTTKIFETQNRAAANPQWSAISQVLSPSSKTSHQYILALAIGSSDDIIYAATGDGHVWATYGNGAHWKACDSGFYGTAKGPIVAMRAHPTNQDHAFAITGGEVWWMVPGSPDPAWTDISGNFPKLKASSLYVDWTQNPLPYMSAHSAECIGRSIAVIPGTRSTAGCPMSG